MALRRGFVRYAFSIQYHGSSFLGFAYLNQQENAVLHDGTDLRGYRSIEGRLREAFDMMVGKSNYENIKVSSRTDRGVHAIKNTCHVDIQERKKKKSRMKKGNDNNNNNNNNNDIIYNNDDDDTKAWDANDLRRGLNYFLSQQGAELLQTHKCNNDDKATVNKNYERLLHRRAKRKLDHWSFHYPMNELRILNMIQAPLTMKNEYSKIDTSQPEEVEWNVRYSASQRTYIYRILACKTDGGGDWAYPFEWDRSWRLLLSTKLKETEDKRYIEHQNEGHQHQNQLIDINAMREAASYLIGEHDFSSFRSRGCQRASPIVSMHEIQVATQPYGEPLFWESTGGLLGIGDSLATATASAKTIIPQLVTIKIVGRSFVYHQVRNMVGALVAVGRGSLQAEEIKEILEAKDRTIAPPMAPAHGLFLADVKHDDIVL